MRRIIFDILEINIAVSIGIAFLCLFAGILRKRYGAGWMKLAWVLLAVRLLIPYNFSLSTIGIGLLNYAGFEQVQDLTAEAAKAGGVDRLKADASAEQEDNTTADASAGRENAADIEVVSARTELEESPAGKVVTDERAGVLDNGPSGDQATALGLDVNQAAGMRYGIADRSGSSDSSMMEEAAAARSTFFYTDLLIRIWIAGVVVSLFYYVVSYLFVYGSCKKSLHPITNAHLIREICELQNKYIGCVKIRVYESCAVSSPMLTGLIHCKLILPADAVQWNAVKLDMIIAHELHHYLKKDLWLKMLMVAACCINWFNPMVYVMKKQSAYDMELACDGSVLLGRDEEEREKYARIMLSFVGGRRKSFAFSTRFGESRKMMKSRIDYMLDTEVKKKGIVSIVTAALLMLVMGVVVSCGYKAGDEAGKQEKNDADISGGESSAGIAKSGETGAEHNNGVEGGNGVTDGQNRSVGANDGDSMEGDFGQQSTFDYNHVYNDIIRYYEGDLYLAKKDGIYYLKDGQGDGELLYSNTYDLRRGMEIDGKYLYFCGSAPEESGSRATVYRMDLDTHDVENALEKFDSEFADFNNVSVYEGNLYVAVGVTSERIGFALNENGKAVRQLEHQAPDFLYREYNDYMRAESSREYMREELTRLNTEWDYEAYQELVKMQQRRYQAVMDVASCKKLLGGRQVVSQYKDESLISIYLENEDATYDYVCDTAGFPMLVTDTGLYYPDISGEIWYADFATKRTGRLYENREGGQSELSLITYDADYVYLLESKDAGGGAENNDMTETYLIRVPRAGGEAQKVYRFKDYVRTYGEDGWYRHCGVYDGWMYFDNRESFRLEPDVNKIQAVNGVESSEAGVEMTRTGWSFAKAYLKNDEETLRSLLVKDFDEIVEMYAYPEQADRIMEAYVGHTYIGGGELPYENIDIGVTGYVYYTFGEYANAGDAEVCMTIRMIKTEDGFRVEWYEVVT